MSTAPARRAGAGATSPGWLLATGIILASLTDAIAGTALALGRPDMIGDTHATPDQFAWFDISYVTAKLIAFLLAPWLVARAPPRATLIVATLAAGLAGAGAAATAQLDLLIALRTIQGLAGGVLLVTGQAILFWAWPAVRQPAVQALFAIGAVVAPATLAPGLEGWLIDAGSWTWVFFAILPIALCAAGLLVMSEPAALSDPVRRTMDWPGLVLLGATMLGVAYLLVQGSRWNWFDAAPVGWAALLSAAALALFVCWRRRVGGDALVDLAVFRNDDFVFAFLVSFVAGAVLTGSAFLIPAFALSVLDFSPVAAGRLVLSSGGLFAASLAIAAWLFQMRRVPPIATIPLGILCIMAAMWMLSGAGPQSGADDLAGAILLRGLGLGFLFLSITLIAFNRLAPAALASGIGLFDIGRQLGGLAGVAWLQTIIDHQVAANRTVLIAALCDGAPALAARLSSIASLLAARGMEAGEATRAASVLLGGAIARQAELIAFDTAFAAVALLFVGAAPLLIAAKIVLARTVGKRARVSPSARD